METCSPSRVLAVRLAVDADIPRLVEMGRRFRAESSYAKFLADNPERMAELGRTLLKNDGLIVLELDGEPIGMLGFIVHSHFISGEKFAGEVFWWVDPEFRGHGFMLVDEAKLRARVAGARHFQMIAPNKKVARVYGILGFEWVESTYQIALGAEV